MTQIPLILPPPWELSIYGGFNVGIYSYQGIPQSQFVLSPGETGNYRGNRQQSYNPTIIRTGLEWGFPGYFSESSGSEVAAPAFSRGLTSSLYSTGQSYSAKESLDIFRG